VKNKQEEIKEEELQVINNHEDIQVEEIQVE
jgi:hypothetical protein